MPMIPTIEYPHPATTLIPVHCNPLWIDTHEVMCVWLNFTTETTDRDT